MKIIGVCGGSGSGKSTVSACLASFGGITFDSDEIYHELISKPSPCVKALADAFGDGILSRGAVDRNELRRIAFADESKRLLLNSISHRYVTEELEKRLIRAEKDGYPFAVIDAPLLLEAGLDARCDMVVAVLADRQLRVNRIIQRDGITEEAATERIERQLCDGELVRRCDAVIRNETDLESVREQCKELLTVMGLCKEDKE